MLVSFCRRRDVGPRSRSGRDAPEAKESKQELLGLFEDQRQVLLPLIVSLMSQGHRPETLVEALGVRRSAT